MEYWPRSDVVGGRVSLQTLLNRSIHYLHKLLRLPFLPFSQVAGRMLTHISDSKSGIRLTKSGKTIKGSTIKLYSIVKHNLLDFSIEKKFDLESFSFRPVGLSSLNELVEYWKLFYSSFTSYLYSKGFYDNYVGLHIKIIKAFKNYLNVDLGICPDESHKRLHRPSESIPVIALSPEKLSFLIKGLNHRDIP